MTGLRAALRRRLDPAAQAEAGVTLVELIVVMFITSIVLAIVGSMFINVANVTSNANGTNTRNAIAANVVNAMTKVISTASNNAVSGQDDPDPAIVVGTATTLTIITYVDTSPTNPTPTRVTYRVDSAGQVFEDRVASVVSGSFFVFTGATTSRPLGGPVVSSGLFTYLNKAGDPVTPGANGLTYAQRNTVASIRLNVVIANSTTTGSATGTGGNDPVQITNTVGMPNLILTGTDS